MAKILKVIAKYVVLPLLGFILVAIFILLFLYIRLGKEGFQKFYVEYYLKEIKLPKKTTFVKVFTGGIHSAKEDSSIYVTSGKNSGVVIFDKTTPGFWEILIPNLGKLKNPTFKFLPIFVKFEDVGTQPQLSSTEWLRLKTDDLQILDFDNNNIKEIVTLWVNSEFTTSTRFHPMIIYWDRGYRIMGMPPIPRQKTDGVDVIIKNDLDKRIYRFPTFSSDDLLYFEDINDDGHIELIRGFMIFDEEGWKKSRGEEECHFCPHNYLFEVFIWENNKWKALYWQNTNKPYFISPFKITLLEVEEERFKKSLKKIMLENLYLPEDY